MPSFLTRLRAGLAKTAQQIREVLGDAGDVDISAEAPAASAAGAVPAVGTVRAKTLDSLEHVEEALISADVGLAATERILTAVKAERQGTLRERVATRDPARARRRDADPGIRREAARDSRRRRQRHGQDDDGRQAGAVLRSRGPSR